MTALLLILAFTLAMAPVVETLWEPLWSRVTAAATAPRVRLRLVGLRMATGLGVALLAATALLWKVYHAPVTHPLLPVGLVTCLGHGLEHGPGLWTHALLVAASLLVMLLVVALFHPVPCFPRGRPRPDLREHLARRGVDAEVETLPGEEPGCWSELTPEPRVLLLGGIEERLPPEELAAVLDHEAGHLALGDHRARVWARAYRRLLGFSDGARALFDAFVHEQERRADDQVLAWQPERRSALARALHVLATQDLPAPPASGVAGAGPLGVLGPAAWSIQQRLARLRGRPEEPPPGVPLRAGPLLGLAALLFVVGSEPGACTLHCLLDLLP